MAESRLLLTFDKDFGELTFRLGVPASCGIVLFRKLDGTVVFSGAPYTGVLGAKK